MGVTRDADLMEMIALAYEAGADPGRWPALLDRVASSIADTSSGLQFEDLRCAEGSFAFSAMADPEYLEIYTKRFAALNPWTRLGASQMRPGRVLVSDEFLPLRELRKTEFYSDFLRPQGIARSLAAVIERNGDVAAS